MTVLYRIGLVIEVEGPEREWDEVARGMGKAVNRAFRLKGGDRFEIKQVEIDQASEVEQ